MDGRRYNALYLFIRLEQVLGKNAMREIKRGN
jgi:hypothetical protein